MKKRLITFLLSLLMPGLGYFRNGENKSFYTTIAVFFSIIIPGVVLRLFTGFWGFAFIFISLPCIYLFTAIHAALKVKATVAKVNNGNMLKFFFTVIFVLITGLSFANRRTVMGFDIMSMGVPVMQPTVLQGDKFLIDTWVYKTSLPARGDIVAHSFNGQQGLYLNRIVGIGNDEIAIEDGKVFLNRQTLNEPYVLPANITKPESLHMKAFVIPAGQYFVMGDNRDASFGDSRFSGAITIDNIVGKTTDVISSTDRYRIGKTLE